MYSLTIAIKPRVFSTNGNIFITLTTTGGEIHLPPISTSGWSEDVLFTQTVDLPSPIDPKQVTGIKIVPIIPFALPANLVAFSEINVTYHAFDHNEPLKLYSSQTPTPIPPEGWMTPVQAELPQQNNDQNKCIENSCCIKKLIGHLNCHK